MPDLTFTWVRRGKRDSGTAALLRIERLCVKVGIRRVLENLDLEVFSGDRVCLTGPNGSGKSTLLNAIAGLDPARIESGRMFFEGKEITNLPAHERARQGISYLRQRNNVFPDLTIDENLQLALGLEGPKLFREKCPEWAAELPGHKRVGLLSGGQRQRIAWVMASLRQGTLLLADEPEAGLSTELSLPIGGTLLLASHTLADWSKRT